MWFSRCGRVRQGFGEGTGGWQRGAQLIAHVKEGGIGMEMESGIVTQCIYASVVMSVLSMIGLCVKAVQGGRPENDFGHVMA